MDTVLSKFFHNFFSHFYEYASSHDEAARMGFMGMSEEEKRELAPILDELVGPRYSSDDLVKLWKSSPAGVNLTNGDQIRQLLNAARKRIG